MSLNVNYVLNSIAGNYKINSNKNKSNSTSSSSSTNNIFAQQAAEIVAEYKAKQEQSEDTTESSGKNMFGMSFSKMANMSTKDFLNYAYNNQAASGFNKESEDSNSKTANIKLPSMVRYGAKVIPTSGKSFMAVVAKFKGMYPTHSEEQIAAKLLEKYSGNSTSGSSLNMSA